MTSEPLETAIEARRFAPAMKAALRRLLAGESYRQAAEAEGVGYRELHRNGGTVEGLREGHLRAWRERWGGAFPTMWRHHLARVDPESGPSVRRVDGETGAGKGAA